MHRITTMAAALLVAICALCAIHQPAHADDQIASSENVTVTVTVMTYTVVMPVEQFQVLHPPAPTPKQEIVYRDIMVTPTPKPSMLDRLYPPAPYYEDPHNVGLNRLGTVAVLLGICVIITLLLSAIVRMLRGVR